MEFGIYRLKTQIQRYPWGSRTFLSSLRGESPSAEPEAELWIGTHPQAPSEVEFEGRWTLLADLLARFPNEVLGTSVVRRFEGRLPFLLKLLAVEEPLSLQLHPDASSARSGFERQQAENVPDAQRTYRDPRHKPELVVALTPFVALRNFRPVADILTLLERAAIPQIGGELTALRERPDSAGLRAFLRALFTLEATQRDAALTQARRAVERHAGDAAFDCLGQLLAAYPQDVGVLAPLLMHRLELEPGQALFQPPGMLHCYLSGAAVEVMADSDNVLRAGLTTKEVDVDAVLRLVEIDGGSSQIIDPQRLDAHRRCYSPRVDEFRLAELTVTPSQPFVGGSQQSVEAWVCVDGAAVVRTPTAVSASLHLRAGDSVLVPAAVERYVVEGEARIWVASVPPAR